MKYKKKGHDQKTELQSHLHLTTPPTLVVFAPASPPPSTLPPPSAEKKDNTNRNVVFPQAVKCKPSTPRTNTNNSRGSNTAAQTLF